VSVLLPGCRERAWEPGEDYERHCSGLWLPAGDDTVPAPDAQPLGVDLFAGAGGFSCGFKQAGFHVIAASDGWATAAITYLINLGGPATTVHLVGDELPEGDKRERAWFREHHEESLPVTELLTVGARRGGAAGSGWIANEAGMQPCEHYYLGDVRALTGERILDDLGLTGDDIGCVFGGPPCQGFSRAGQRKPDDPRNELVFEFMRIVCEIHPQVFCMENVPGIVDMVTREGIPVIDAISQMAEEGGMGTFEAIRKSLAGTAGVGAALRTKKVRSGKPRPGSTVPRDRLDIEDRDAAQLALEAV
jgi:DNA (cytosine-5)-methyltransferase 1